MDDLLPSYQSVVSQNPWELVAPYLLSDDLCSAALVCQKWHEIFTPQLWGNPASHFGVQNDTVYVALTRFKRTLTWARLSVRELTHTLHLPPAHAQIYGGPHAEWLRDCLERLPRLQSLIVDGLPFFDHAALLTLRHSSQWWASTHLNAFPSFALRLLDASGCINATSFGLATAFLHFPELISLDLSRTLAARDENVFSQLCRLRNLRVLRMRKLGLRDPDLDRIAKVIGTKVRSLDVSDNVHLTDKSARKLLDFCVREVSMNDPLRRQLPDSAAWEAGGKETEIFGTENLDVHLRNKLTGGFVGSLAIEQAPDVGVTHLYISGNSFTVEGVSGLLRARRLQVLDIGTLPVVMKRPYSDEGEEDIVLPGVEKLTPVLADGVAKKLAYLRVHYSIITKDGPSDPLPSPRVELDAGHVHAEMPARDLHELAVQTPPEMELEAEQSQIHELPAEPVGPVELPAHSLVGAIAGMSGLGKNSSTTDTPPPAIEVIPEPTIVKSGPAHAPEPVFLGQEDTPLSPARDARGRLSPVSPMTPFPNITDEIPNGQAPSPTHLQTPPTRSRHNSTHYVEDRRTRLDMRYAQSPRLHPGMLPRAHTLVFTDVPTTTPDRQLIDRLIHFITSAAEESAIALLRAHHTYMLPPGRTRTTAEKQHASTIFALRRIVLEMAPPAPAPSSSNNKKTSSGWHAPPTKSSTEDPDSEAFWHAAAHDFSFFTDDECGLPPTPSHHLPLAAMDGLMLAPSSPSPSSSLPPPNPDAGGGKVKMYDTISELAAFRKDRKAAYDAARAAAPVGADVFVEGHWDGRVTIVRRKGGGEGEEGEEDYYGNRFEGGWLYR
ncbi:hypothetical protein BU24DRAFT_439007 [Aaosphaeria arxii CBS 175.79]|uniref:F-box domain-containing protein n=1 Tax=Aaosphaeria arxii CBS 175.79 TaxID=1450172 RepID=A0A6A5Y9Z5_9PLEO|nr:uncharacterized protein BU24DRAFT_439007 [Aaosphaeria arxii CBS 175.79]KAF2022258.1 hypothetical protein BU24DRAFT_439007 [Aaosphaeria arxii CBS 175.79]